MDILYGTRVWYIQPVETAEIGSLLINKDSYQLVKCLFQHKVNFSKLLTN